MQNMTKLVLPANKANYFCLKVSVAAGYGGWDLQRELSNTSTFPMLVKDGVTYEESNAISRLLGGDSLWGDDQRENSQIYQWIEFADHEVYPAGCAWSFPLLGIKNLNKQEITHARHRVEKYLGVLDEHLLTNMFLVGDRITQADIACASALLLPYQLMIGESMQRQYISATRWFKTIVNQPQFRGELVGPATGEVPLCRTTSTVEEIRDKLSKGDLVGNDSSDKDGVKEKPKSATQLKKEAKKREKLEKFNAKKKKLESQSSQTKVQKNIEKTDKKSSVIKYDKPTLEGEKKDVSGELTDGYSPQYVEAAWYAWWVKMGFFKPEYGRENVHDENPKGKFMICLPPPNVTGSLHLGHALTNTIQDVLSRWHRMQGETVLWNPGTDHAGIATQVVVEKKLWKERKLSRHDLGREAFVEEVWKWKNEKGDEIYHQLKRLGSSVDWDRSFFTMNEDLSNAVKHSFIQLHDRGIIFRSNRLINWSCTLRSAISDIEVNKQELTGRTMLSVPGYTDKIEFGVLISFAYPVVDGEPGEELVVATTRIETMLGDTAVAVHPDDDRYKHLHGKSVHHPLCSRRIPIICDEMVERDFGTGAVKITPAHDPNDYECGKRHKLEFITIFTDDGFVTNTGTRFDGMKRFVARTAVLEALKEKGLYKETTDNPMVVPICSRSKDIVEPLIKVQWFMDCKEAARKAVHAVQEGTLKITPDSHCKTWYHWLNNIRDWCISRQLWWGHRVPAYFVTIDDPAAPKGQEGDGEYWISAMNEEEAREKAAAKFKVPPSKILLRQDGDVLDTWYSSGLLPFSIFGWPNQTADLATFFPGTLLETGHDILFFWVARMVMFSIMLTGKLPFKEVYLHAMVRDAHGRKMSKSLGNVIDPVDVINGITLEELHQSLMRGNLDNREVERAKAGQKQDYPNGIPECGTDALRFALCAYTCQGRDINLDVLRILGYRFFCNKLWNAFKFATRGLGPQFKPNASHQVSGKESLMDRWILSKLSRAIEASGRGLETYEFPTYTTALFNFWLYDLCDVYLEYLKPVFSGSDQSAIATSRDVLYTCLEVALRLIHPLMPFVSEELWQRLPRRPNQTQPSVSVCEWPKVTQHPWADDVIESDVEMAMSVTKATRSLRSEYNLNKAKADLYVRSTDQFTDLIARYCDLIQTLTSSSNVHLLRTDQSPPPGCAVAIVNDKCDVNLLLKGVLDFDKEARKLRAKREEQTKKLKAMKEKTSRSEYKSKVPESVQKADSDKMIQMEAEIRMTSEAEENFFKMINE